MARSYSSPAPLSQSGPCLAYHYALVFGDLTTQLQELKARESALLTTVSELERARPVSNPGHRYMSLPDAQRALESVRMDLAVLERERADACM